MPDDHTTAQNRSGERVHTVDALRTLFESCHGGSDGPTSSGGGRHGESRSRYPWDLGSFFCVFGRGGLTSLARPARFRVASLAAPASTPPARRGEVDLNRCESRRAVSDVIPPFGVLGAYLACGPSSPTIQTPLVVKIELFVFLLYSTTITAVVFLHV